MPQLLHNFLVSLPRVSSSISKPTQIDVHRGMKIENGKILSHHITRLKRPVKITHKMLLTNLFCQLLVPLKVVFSRICCSDLNGSKLTLVKMCLINNPNNLTPIKERVKPILKINLF